MKKAMKCERADKDKLKAIFMTSKGITPEAIAARVGTCAHSLELYSSNLCF